MRLRFPKRIAGPLLTAMLFLLAGCGDSGPRVPKEILTNDTFAVYYFDLNQATPERIEQAAAFYIDTLSDEGLDQLGELDLDRADDAVSEFAEKIGDLRDDGVEAMVIVLAGGARNQRIGRFVKVEQGTGAAKAESALQPLAGLMAFPRDLQLNEINDRWLAVEPTERWHDFITEGDADEAAAERINRFLQQGGDRAVRIAFSLSEDMKTQLRESRGPDDRLTGEFFNAIEGGCIAMRLGENPDMIATVTATSERRARQLHGLYDASLLYGRTFAEASPLIAGVLGIAEPRYFPLRPGDVPAPDADHLDQLETLLQPTRDDATLTLTLDAQKMRQLTQTTAEAIEPYEQVFERLADGPRPRRRYPERGYRGEGPGRGYRGDGYGGDTERGYGDGDYGGEESN